MKPRPGRPAAPGVPLAGTFAERDLLFTQTDFDRVRTLIYQRAGIVLAEHKKEMAYGRLGRRVRHFGLARFADYLARLERDPAAPEWQAFTNALTTNLTSFFRENHHFPLLARHVTGRRGPVRVWSAAASTGEEAYSIAITLLEALGPQADIQVLATDIDTDALERARQGVYPLEQVAKLDERLRKRYFQKGGGRRAGYARVHPDLAARVRFEALNLIDTRWPPAGPFDAIFCRNVMIYFDKDTQARLLERFVPWLKPDGLLFAGHSESFSYTSDCFTLRGQTVYTLA